LSAVAAPFVYLILIAVGRLYFRYKFKGLKEFRADIFGKLKDHNGPVIWTANHLTLIDSFLVFWAVFPWRGTFRSRLIPWSIPEYRNYYHLGGPVTKRLIRLSMYLCRSIPFLRKGDDAAAVQWRERVFEKCVWILRDGGAIFVYPEAGRARSGWFDSKRPKDFSGRLALDVPQAKFLCIYLRAENQLYTTACPDPGENFRMRGELIAAVQNGEKTPREVAQRLFNEFGRLQGEWFKDSGPALLAQRRVFFKNCAGNDVVDLKSEGAREHFDLEAGEADPEWLERHLTGKELGYFNAQEKAMRFKTFWKFFAAKEAASKALGQSGIFVPSGGFRTIEIDLFRRTALHRSSGCRFEIRLTDEDEDKIHCLAVLRGGSAGDDDVPGDVIWGIDLVPSGENPGDWTRRRCLELIAKSSDDIPNSAQLDVAFQEGVPRILRRGKVCDWGVSFSHSGRFAAYSFMIS
jgi:phosphopantetheinyl transferase (holo-ACP synthase)/1-acyl-sn-glycerol-3-phosphate acyltransferase